MSSGLFNHLTLLSDFRGENNQHTKLLKPQYARKWLLVKKRTCVSVFARFLFVYKVVSTTSHVPLKTKLTVMA